jgi:hypothetical protein
MTRSAITMFVLCLLALPTAALADEYQLNGPPDISITGMTFADHGTYATLSGGTVSGGTVATIIDATGTGCTSPCSIANPLPWAVMSADQSGFSIYNQGNTSQIYMTATLVVGSYVYDTTEKEVGEEFLVKFDDLAFWNLVETTEGSGHTVSATDLTGTEMVLDVHLGVFNKDSGVYDAAIADMTPAGATPEPATLTLLCSGLAAGLIRKRLARNKR